MPNEPSMEEILSSIKRIIAQEGDFAEALTPNHAAHRAYENPPFMSDNAEEILELTHPVGGEVLPLATATKDPDLLSKIAAEASRQSFASLYAQVGVPEAAPNTLEGLVKEMLKPMLKDWLDTHLPELVERLVSREIERITGKNL